MNTEAVRNAGKAVAAGKELGRELVTEGASWLETADAIEAEIEEMGAKPAFPCNVSANAVAAHDLPDHEDERTFSEGDVVKLDIGAHVDGWIADSAVTVIVGDNEKAEKMLKTANLALEEAVKLLNPGNTIGQVSTRIEEVIRKDGFSPVVNLTGHKVERYDVHASPSVPNVGTESSYEFSEGDVFAVEPFVTDGVGMVKESGTCQVYSWVADKNVRFPESSTILRLAKNDYSKLPFAKRWLVRDANISPAKLKLVLQKLVDRGSLHDYPPLKEMSDAVVTQAEHTVIIGEEPEVVT